jgi:hypothetical protein
VQIWTPSTWNVEVDFPSTEGFDVLMAMSFVHPLRKWASTSMSFNGGGTNLPYHANKAFTHGYAFQHNITLALPLPSYR